MSRLKLFSFLWLSLSHTYIYTHTHTHFLSSLSPTIDKHIQSINQSINRTGNDQLHTAAAAIAAAAAGLSSGDAKHTYASFEQQLLDAMAAGLQSQGSGGSDDSSSTSSSSLEKLKEMYADLTELRALSASVSHDSSPPPPEHDQPKFPQRKMHAKVHGENLAI